MKNKYLYEDCYRILNTNHEVSWNELRKSYKTQIQKWHPDRFDEGSIKKDAAEQKIKAINKAYQQVSEYYRKNGALPRIEQAQAKTRPIVQKTTQARSQPGPFSASQKSRPEKTDRKKHTLAKNTFFTSLTIIVISYAVYDFSSINNSVKPEPQNLQPSQNQKKTATHQQLEHDKADTTDSLINIDTNEEKNKTKNIIREQFTYGSSIGDVIMIQGTPTKIEGDIWYYGESKVYFNRGIVQRWVRKPGSPLNAGIKP